MISTLLAVKRGDRKIPQSFECLAALAVKMKINEKDEDAPPIQKQKTATRPVLQDVCRTLEAQPMPIQDKQPDSDDPITSDSDSATDDEDADDLDKLSKSLFKKKPSSSTPSRAPLAPRDTPEKTGLKLSIGTGSSFDAFPFCIDGSADRDPHPRLRDVRKNEWSGRSSS